MRIFQSIHRGTNAQVSGSQTWYRNLYEPLVDLGHDVIFYPYEKSLFGRKNINRKASSNFSQKLLDTVKHENQKKPIDLFFSYFTDGMIDPGVIDEISKLGVLTCNFSCNNIHQFYIVKEISPHYDVNLHSEKYAHQHFVDVGANPHWWPMASNPNYFTPTSIDRNLPVSFVGANYALRAKYIEYLLENKIDVHAYGPGWLWGSSNRMRSFLKRIKFLLLSTVSLSIDQQYHASAQLAIHDMKRRMCSRYQDNFYPPVSDQELINLYSQSEISLGFLEVHDQHNPVLQIKKHLHLREFEAPMCGALYLTGFSEELAEMFEPDKEVLIYRNQYELLDKVRYYLKHPSEAEKIRKAGRKRALQDHSYHIRYKNLFQELGLPE